ncbi:MAG: flagellin [Bauldia sp.]
MANITLTAPVRNSLAALQSTADLQAITQQHLSTGKKVNSALDGPQAFFTASSLYSRAGDLSNLLDAMSNGIQTIQAANNGLTSITNLLHQMQAAVSQARSDGTSSSVTPGAATASNTTNSSTAVNNKMTFSLSGGVSVDIATHSGTTAATLTGTGGAAVTAGTAGVITITSAGVNGGVGVDVTVASGDTLTDVKDSINTALGLVTNGSDIVASIVGGEIKLTNSTGHQIALTDDGNGSLAQVGFATSNRISSDGVVGTAKTVDELVTAINSSQQLIGKVRATNVAGTLSLVNYTTTAIGVTGLTSGGAITGSTSQTATLAAGTGGGISTVRQSLLTQFNALRDQIDQLAGDSGFNGINLLNGDNLRITFNEQGTSSIDVHTADDNGNAFAINSTNLGISSGTTVQFADNSQLDTLQSSLATALTTLRTQASTLGSSLSTTQTRQDFTKATINTLNIGADALTVADINTESANMLALQTRQQLSISALSLANQASQAVLRLFG